MTSTMVHANSPTRIRGKIKEISSKLRSPRVLSVTAEVRQRVSKTITKRPPQSRLQDRLYTVMVSHRLTGVLGQDKGFIPDGKLAELLHLEAIEEELMRCRKLRFSNKQNEVKAQAQEICGTAAGDSTTVSRDTLVGSGCGEYTPPKNRSYKKILAILVLMNQQAKIKSFLQEGICDTDLPLALVKRTDSVASWVLQPNKAKDISPSGLKGWRKVTFNKFLEWQWTVLAPSFASSSGKEKLVPHHCFHDSEILPFTSWEKLHAEGGFGQVYKAEIHSDHHTLKNANAPIQAFAIKQLFSRDLREFKREVNVLRRFSNDKHKHLISLLATYEQHGGFNLIFPWAEYDLYQYWKQVNPSPSPGEHKDNLVWLSEQCQGIADGLSYVHRYSTETFKSLLDPSSPTYTEFPTGDNKEVCQLFGRHGDIKPENILWFPGLRSSAHKRMGTLKITDFGIAEFSTKPAVNKARRGCTPNSPTYRALEIDFSVNGGLISPSYDIWALGCVHLEFITWWLGAEEYVNEFALRRGDVDPVHWQERLDPFSTDTFFMIRYNTNTGKPEEARVKDVVSKFIEELRCHHSCNDFLREFIDLVQQKMIIVESPLEESTGSRRHCSRHVAADLAEMIGKHQLAYQPCNR